MWPALLRTCVAREAPQGGGKVRLAMVGQLLQRPAGHPGWQLAGFGPAGRLRCRGDDPDLQVRDALTEGLEDGGAEVAQPFGPGGGVRMEDGAPPAEVGQPDMRTSRCRQGGSQGLVGARQALSAVGNPCVRE